MTMIQDIQQLRKFGIILAAGFVGIFGTLAPYLSQHAIPWWPWCLGALLLFLSFIKPLWLHYIYQPWMKLGSVLGWINTRIILGIIFFALITPLGLIMRLCAKDKMQRTYDKTLLSYRKKITPQPIQHMEKPF